MGFNNIQILRNSIMLFKLTKLRMHSIFIFHWKQCKNLRMKMPNLQQLCLTDTKIIEDNGSFLKGFPSLKHLFTANKIEYEFLM